MRTTWILALLLVNTIYVYCQVPSPTIGVGIVREKVDSNITRQIRIINTGFGNIIAFPAEYSIRRESHYPDSLKRERAYFTPDSLVLLKMNADLKAQYCDALRFQVKESRESSEKLFGNDFDKDDFTKWMNRVNSTCDQKASLLDSIHKQVIAFSSEKYNGRVLYIQLVDFRNDPYALKEKSKMRMIDGWHGWFETNIETFFYHIDHRKLSVHGENFKEDKR